MQTVAAADTALSHRLADLPIRLIDRQGQPLAGAEVTIEQLDHDFVFGNAPFCLIDFAVGEGAPADAALAEQWLGLFNTATLPFYWGQFEPDRGKPRTARLKRAADWFADRRIRLKGHPLTWHTEQPAWLTNLPLREIERELRHRIRREVSGFAGLIDTWDALNESVIAPVFAAEPNGVTRLTLAKGRIELIRLSFAEAKAANPRAFLLLNDFDLSSAYECLIEGCLEAGVPIDAIGLQTHMHQGYWGEETMLAMVERFARYGLPLHLTENSLVSGHLMPPEIVDLNDYRPADWPSTAEGEERQADQLTRHYRSLVGHPAVAAITYWDFADASSWLGAPTGLIRRDGTPKPAYDALKGLVKGDWWIPPTGLTTDCEGRFRLTGFAGDYRVSTAQGFGAVTVTRLEDQPRDVVVAPI
ncbi:MAG: endo-1,4-beta-xylanase [Bifidobacteriaceae bacterium]|jgi:GH35 family endo-1,4-beta-xylanase|nr:endo-1,4-beta-xylanase [Bifidobacteriaceae bacterium]